MSTLKNALIIILLLLVIRGGYELSYPSKTTPDLIYDGVFLHSVLKHISKITEYPHAVGQPTHKVTGRYIERHVQQINNPRVKINRHDADYYNVNNRRAASLSNYIIQYPGQHEDAPAVMLMAHYDAARFSAEGAADDAAGVAVALEVFKAYIQQNPNPKNKLMLLITDGEELGLLGAKAFIDDQLRYHNIGAIINFEARGSSGPAIMLPETEGGNLGLIKAYQQARVPMPVSSSLFADIYKMMPNDTDVTPFKKTGINAFNLAFIDDHFNYHTQSDDLSHLSLNSLSHHLIQSKTLFNYLAMSDLSALKSEQSLVYFTLPGQGIVAYESDTSFLIICMTWFLWLVLTLLTIRQSKAGIKALLSGIKPLTLTVFFAFILNYVLLAAVYTFIPGWKDILQGFPYGGHPLINAQLLVTLILFVVIYRRRHNQQIAGDVVISIGLWLTLISLLSRSIPGAGYLVIPALFALPLGFLALYKPSWSKQLAPFLLLLMMVPLGALMVTLPVAIGIWLTPATMVILVLMIAPFSAWVETGQRQDKSVWLFLVPVIYSASIIVKHHDFSPHQPLPTSINYLYDLDTEQGYFFNADKRRGDWLSDLFKQTLNDEDTMAFQKQYKKPLTNLSLTGINASYPAQITYDRPLDQSLNKRINVTINTVPGTEIVSIYTQQVMTVYSMSVDNRRYQFETPKTFAPGYKLIEYHITDNPQIDIQLNLSHESDIEWQIQTHNSDLLSTFDLPARPLNQMPKAFIKTDLITTVQTWSPGDN